MFTKLTCEKDISPIQCSFGILDLHNIHAQIPLQHFSDLSNLILQGKIDFPKHYKFVTVM